MEGVRTKLVIFLSAYLKRKRTKGIKKKNNVCFLSRLVLIFSTFKDIRMVCVLTTPQIFSTFKDIVIVCFSYSTFKDIRIICIITSIAKIYFQKGAPIYYRFFLHFFMLYEHNFLLSFLDLTVSILEITNIIDFINFICFTQLFIDSINLEIIYIIDILVILLMSLTSYIFTKISQAINAII